MSTTRPGNNSGSSKSRCVLGRPFDLTWVDYVDSAHPSPIELDDWIDSLAPFARDSVLGQIDALRDLAAEGGIRDGDESRLKPIARDPDMYELRWKLLNKAVRQYHAEPRSLPTTLVKLHIHIKKSGASKVETKNLQNSEISQAILRHRGGIASHWGS